MDEGRIFDRLGRVPGEVGFYYQNFATGRTLGLRENDPFEAASVIKLPVWAAVRKLAAEGAVSLDETLTCRQTDKLPVCGALCLFTGEVTADLRTLGALMISLSDNTATNLLLRRFGLDRLNEQFRLLGLEQTRLERLLFDGEAAGRGLENRIVLRELGGLMEKIFRRSLVSEEVSRELEALLLQQQIGHKIPGYLPDGVPVAHKTGEDEGLTNDVGVVYGAQPFFVGFACNRTDVPEAERAIREISLWLWEENGRPQNRETAETVVSRR